MPVSSGVLANSSVEMMRSTVRMIWSAAWAIRRSYPGEPKMRAFPAASASCA